MRTEVREGEPAEEILAPEEGYEPTTILIGSRGHSRLRRLLIGSGSEDLVDRASGERTARPAGGDSVTLEPAELARVTIPGGTVISLRPPTEPSLVRTSTVAIG